ncbi:MAG: DUF2635 domain-containing protein [Oxalobacteraceae bacterium]|nr:DUF2635 domain-containing protein [Oxalobacteraceae bacterium]
MTEQKQITPRAGIIVPLPDGNGNLPPEGKALALTSYWYQRQRDGDVTIADLPVPATAPAEILPETPKTKSK